MFHPNQKVICINNGPMKNNRGLVPPAPQLSEGTIYTVKSVSPGGKAILLVEEVAFDDYRGFNSSRFRPIVEKKTDISIFTEMLKTMKENQPA